jgi:hemolysin D
MNPRLQDFGDVLKRYGAVFRHTWQHRVEMESISRLPYEAEFLPAVLALQETPVSPVPRLAIWMLVSFSTLALLWSIFGCIDVVAIAQGKVIPNDHSKIIQPFETATVKAIHVTDGQTVKRGETLIELDAVTAIADKNRILGDITVARLLVARGQAMLISVKSGKAPNLNRLADINAVLFEEAESLLFAQHGEYVAKLKRIEAESLKREAEIHSTQALINKLEQTLPIVEKRTLDYRNLASRHFVSMHDVLEQEQSRIERQGDLASQRSRLNEIKTALQEVQAQRQEIIAGTLRVSLDSIAEGQQKIASLEQELLKANTKSGLMRLTSPVAGTVQQLSVYTEGGVVTPAQPLMVVVPSDAMVEVEAFIENKDIGFIKPNQDAEVKVETFQYTKYGTIDANVTSVSHDAISDEKRGLIYSMRVRMKRSGIRVEDSVVNLTPGMAVTVEIKTGKRRLIDFFLSPLLTYNHESLRER